MSEFKATEFGRDKNVIADTSMADEIRAIGVRKTIALTRMSQHTIEKLLRGDAVKRKTHEHVLKAIQASRRSTILESRAWSTNVKTGPERATAVAAPP